MEKYDCLKLDNQLCFPLYACSKEVVRRYHPLLSALDLTYTQYIVMMVLWEDHECSVSDLGKRLYLDSGTLTPLLKKLETKCYLTRHRSAEDERIVLVTVTEEGMALREKAVSIPPQMGACIRLEPEEAIELHRLLGKLINILQEPDAN